MTLRDADLASDPRFEKAPIADHFPEFWSGEQSPIDVKVFHEVIVTSTETIVNNNMRMKPQITPPETFGDWLRRELGRREWIGADLARRMGSSNGTVSNWLTGKRVPSPETVQRIAMVLGADSDYLLALAGHRQADPYYDPNSPEAKLLPFIRQIEWTDEAFEMIRRQLEFLAEVQRGERDR